MDCRPLLQTAVAVAVAVAVALAGAVAIAISICLAMQTEILQAQEARAPIVRS